MSEDIYNKLSHLIIINHKKLKLVNRVSFNLQKFCLQARKIMTDLDRWVILKQMYF